MNGKTTVESDTGKVENGAGQQLIEQEKNETDQAIHKLFFRIRQMKKEFEEPGESELTEGTAKGKQTDYRKLCMAEMKLYRLVKDYRNDICLSYEARMIRIIRNFADDTKSLQKLDLPEPYLEKAQRLLREQPGISDLAAARRLRE